MKTTIEYLKECFEYKDGKLYWKKRPRHHFSCERSYNQINSKFEGLEAGFYRNDKSGPRYKIKINYKQYFRSIIIWAIHNNRWPILKIDHKDRNTLNDKIENLREATDSQQRYNSKLGIRNTSGHKGVSWDKGRQKWLVEINNKKIGRYNSYIEACEIYNKMIKIYHGEFAYNGVD